MKRVPLGVSDFKKLREGDYYYIDKTLLIKDILRKKSEVFLFPRPRRFGKTLNLSMLYYFFSNDANARDLFDKTAICDDATSMSHQGKYPVIFLTFKDVKVSDWQQALQAISFLIKQEFEHHYPALAAIMSASEQASYQKIVNCTADLSVITHSLRLLCDLLCRCYKRRVIILLDEYDAPIHAAYQHGYYQQMVEFIRNFFSSAFKDNEVLELGVLTVILRTAKEGIFSGLNNLNVCTILEEMFSDKFGFTQPEADALLEHYGFTSSSIEIRQWYNGYNFAGTTIYNPWSLLMCVDKDGVIAPYWANTSDNAMVMDVIARADEFAKQDLELLLENQSIHKIIDEAFAFVDIEQSSSALWSLLVFAGYLTLQSQENVEGRWTGSLVIPNKEIRLLYKQLLERSFDRVLSLSGIKQLQQALLDGDGGLLQEIVQKYVINSMSAFDLPSDEPEKSYHLFILGMLVTLSDMYDVVSNRESGFGRYDTMLIPKNSKQRGIVIEFKRVIKRETLEMAAEQALKQIREKQYAQELKKRGVHTITLFGIAFKGKEVLLQQDDL